MTSSRTTVDHERVRAAYRRCFCGPDGRIVLADLVSRTLHRPLGPDVGDSVLRHAEGQRALVSRILDLSGQDAGNTLSVSLTGKADLHSRLDLHSKGDVPCA